VSKVRRNQAHLPYRRIPVRTLLFECNKRIAARGPRAFEMMAALIYRWPQVQSGIIYIGDGRMAELMRRCGKTAHRAKRDLERCGLIRLHRTAGGKILNSNGQPVAAATGYEIDPAVLEKKAPAPPRRPAAPSDTPAQARVRREGQEKIRAALDTMRARPGP
jgi:hypothetical protein